MIQLKAQVKQLFADAGIPELTVGRDSNNYLTIVGKECGQPIMTISQVEVSASMTKAVRKIVIDDYLTPALTKHSKDFMSMIAAKKKAKAANALVTAELALLGTKGYSSISTKEVHIYTSTGKAYAYNYKEEEFGTMYYATPKILEEVLLKIPLVKPDIKKVLKLKEEAKELDNLANEEMTKVQITCGW